MIPNLQKALLFSSGSLRVSDRAVPQPKSGELLVKIISAALNPIDQNFLHGFTVGGKAPSVLGCDVAGIVQHVGPDVSGFKEGDAVFYQTSFLEEATNAFQQYGVISADLVAKKPSSVSFDEASTAGIAGGTAAVGLYQARDSGIGAGLTPPWREDGLNKYAGQPFLIMGGSSSVGQYVIQLARLSGFSPIITTSSLSNAEYLKELGATHVFDRHLHSEDLKAKVKENLKSPLLYAYDAVGHNETSAIALHSLEKGGTLISVAGVESSPGKTTIMTYGSLHLPQNHSLGVEFISAISTYFADRRIKPNRVEVLPHGLHGISRGLERLAAISGHKLVARPQE